MTFDLPLLTMLLFQDRCGILKNSRIFLTAWSLLSEDCHHLLLALLECGGVKFPESLRMLRHSVA
jgi:hypothetical protein